MKKLFALAFVAGMITLASCGSSTSDNVAADSVIVDSVATDSLAADSATVDTAKNVQ